MEALEQEAVGSVLNVCKPGTWKRYVDDTFQVIKNGEAEKLTHLNVIDTTHQEDEEMSIALLDTLADSKVGWDKDKGFSGSSHTHIKQ